MNIKKKIFAFGLSAIMAMSMAVPAFAAPAGNFSSTATTKDVYGTYGEALGDGGDVIAVLYRYGSMEFTWHPAGGSTQQWDPNTLSYKTVTGGTGSWTCDDDADKIEIMNRSNCAVDVTVGVTTGDLGQAISFSSPDYDEATKSVHKMLASAEGKTDSTVPMDSITIRPSDATGLSAGQTNVKLFTLKMSVKAAG